MLDDTSSASSFELIHEEPDPIDNDIDWEFSIIEEATDDDFSLLDFCGDILSNIELLPTVRCYKHSRNAQLNRKLDFAVLFSIAVVTGLGLGNFLGHSSQCMRMRSAVEDLHKEMNIPRSIPCSSELMMATKRELAKEKHDTQKRQIEHSSNFNVENLPLVSLLENDVDNNSHVQLISTRLIAAPSVEKVSVVENLPVPLATVPNAENISDISFVSLELIPIISTSSLSNLVHVFNEGDKVKTNSHDEIKDTIELPKQFTYYDMLSLLKTDIGDIVVKMQNLITVMINKEEITSENSVAVKNMFQQFMLSVGQKTSELKELVDASSFDAATSGKKQFVKMSEVIIKSVDTLMKDSVVKMLGNEKKTTDAKLHDVVKTGHNIINELEQRWNYQKKKLCHTKNRKFEEKEYKVTKYPNDRNNLKNKKRDAKFDKKKSEKERSFDYKEKRNTKKKYFKNKYHEKH